LRRKNRAELAEGMGLSDSMDRLGSYKTLKQRQEEMMRMKDEELKAQRQAEIEEMLQNKKVFL
jgi:hypothetical protein